MAYSYYLFLLTFPICIFPSSFLCVLPSHLLCYLFFYLLPCRIWTRSVFQTGGRRRRPNLGLASQLQQQLAFWVCVNCCAGCRNTPLLPSSVRQSYTHYSLPLHHQTTDRRRPSVHAGVTVAYSGSLVHRATLGGVAIDDCMTLHTTTLKSILTICTITGEGVRWLWACQQRVSWSLRRTVTASVMPWTAWSSTFKRSPKLLHMILEDNLKAV